MLTPQHAHLDLTSAPPRPRRHRHTWTDGELAVELECVWRTRSCRCGEVQYRRNAPALPGHRAEDWTNRDEALARRRAWLDVNGPGTDDEVSQGEHRFHAHMLL